MYFGGVLLYIKSKVSFLYYKIPAGFISGILGVYDSFVWGSFITLNDTFEEVKVDLKPPLKI